MRLYYVTSVTSAESVSLVNQIHLGQAMDTHSGWIKKFEKDLKNVERLTLYCFLRKNLIPPLRSRLELRVRRHNTF